MTAVYLALAVASLIVAAISLRFPSSLSYDPWSWIIWGREIVHGRLATNGGPTWKPLAMVFTTPLSVLGSTAPRLWLVIARAGGAMALGCAFVLGYRLTRRAFAQARSPVAGSRRHVVERLPAVLAGLMGAGGLLVVHEYVYVVSQGYSEGIMLSLAFLAVLRHLDGARGQAFVLGFGAALDRPEVWLPLLGYAVVVWREQPNRRALVLILIGLILPLWLVPDLIGSGSLLRGVNYAMYARGAGTASCPVCAELTRYEWPLVISPFRVGVVLALAVGPMIAMTRAQPVARARRSAVRRWFAGNAPLMAVLGGGVLLLLEDAVLTELKFSGSDRYLFVGAAMVLVVGAVGWGTLAAGCAAALSRRFGHLAGPVGATAAAVGLILLLTPTGISGGASLSATYAGLRYQASVVTDIRAAVRHAGGARRLAACGRVQTNPQLAPLVAYLFDEDIPDVEGQSGRVLVEGRANANAALVPNRPAGHGYRRAATHGSVRVLTRC